MRFLKNKVSLKKETIEDEKFDSELNNEKQDNIKQEDIASSEKKSNASIQKQEETYDSTILRGKSIKPISHADSKNIIKNYGKALCGFAASPMAIPYINNLVSQIGYESIDIEKFMKYMKAKKESTNSIENIRKLLIEEESDNYEEKAFKKLFKELSVIFLKFFSVNWIFSGRLVHKLVHLKFRFKMLRRIKNPELFTYLKGSACFYVFS